MDPLEVFAVDADMNRATGSIPYKSLQWNRRYYEPGQFSMVVPADMYDDSWRYILCDDRPETGIVQKVEFTDSATTYDGIDEVTVSGFFLEQVLNNYTFLAEETEQQTVVRHKPQPVQQKMPSLFKGEDGKLYTELEWYTWGEPNFVYRDVETGEVVAEPEGEKTYLQLDPSDGYDLITYPLADGSGGTWDAGWYKTDYSYYAEDGELHNVDADGNDTVVSNVIGTPSNSAIIDDGDGTYSWIGGISQLESQTYYRRAQAWEYNKINRPGVVVSDDGNTITYQVEVKGPWQLRTDLGEVGVPVDNVQTVIKWCQRAFGNSLTYDEAPFEGVQKVLSPSFKRMGDMFFEELKTVEASCHVLYDFELNQCVFQVWRGFDRTQRDDDEGYEDVSSGAVASAVALASPLTASGSSYVVSGFPEGFTKLSFIGGTGTQYIDTGLYQNQDTRIVFDGVPKTVGTQNPFGAFFGSSYPTNFEGSEAQAYNGALFYNYFDVQIPQGTARPGDFIHIDANKNVVTMTNNGSQVYSRTFSAKTWTSGTTITLLRLPRQDPIGCHTDIYSCQIFDDGTLIRDFIPARRDSDQVLGMIDMVSGDFYTNAGTGAFVPGSAVPKLTLTYDANSGSYSGSTASQQAYEGDVVSVSACGFSVADKVFTGWNTSQSGGGTAYQPGSEYTFGSSGATLYAQWSSIDDSLSYSANSVSATGQMSPTVGIQGQSVVVAECAFQVEDGFFEKWNTKPDGSGTDYDPGDSFLLTSGADVLYAQWVIEVPPTPGTSDEKAPWAVFSDTWGTMYGYSASRDESNYRNKCYVLYDYDEPSWDDDGSVLVNKVFGQESWQVSYAKRRAFSVVRLEDDMPDLETYLDARDQKPPCDGDWSREPYDHDPTDELSGIDKSMYEAFEGDLYAQGERLLTNDYPIVYNLDAGTLNVDGYRADFDLGDLVDMEVSTIGIKKEARIIGIDEIYEAGNTEIRLEIGDETVSVIDKSKLV